MGTSEMSWFVDFVPRYTKLIELVLKEQGARTIQEEKKPEVDEKAAEEAKKKAEKR